MKRTRRIEVIRYSRRVTVSQDKLADDEADEQQDSDLNLKVSAAIPPPLERVDYDGSVSDDAAADHAPRRLFFRLGDLIRARR